MVLTTRLNDSTQSYVLLTATQQVARDQVLAKLLDGRYPQEEVPCFCGSDGGLEIAKRDRYGLPVTTLLCETCGLLRSSPRMTEAATSAFYDNEYREMYNVFGKSPDELFATEAGRGRIFHSMLSKLVPPNGMVFEVGTGSGGTLVPFKEEGLNVCGADLGSEYLEAGRSQGIDLIHGTIEDLRDQRGQADLVLLIHVFEHFLDLRKELKRLRSLVKPGGWLFIEVPGLQRIVSSYKGDILHYLQNAHTYHFTESTMAYVLESCGFKVSYSDQLVYALAQPIPDCESLDVEPPADSVVPTLSYLTQLEAELERNAALEATKMQTGTD